MKELSRQTEKAPHLGAGPTTDLLQTSSVSFLWQEPFWRRRPRLLCLSKGCTAAAFTTLSRRTS